jgi:short-subunit dehydrogenase involved in D-alanine esterification of teichoic acids
LADRRPAHPNDNVVVQNAGIINDINDLHGERLDLCALDDRLAEALHARLDLTK